MRLNIDALAAARYIAWFFWLSPCEAGRHQARQRMPAQQQLNNTTTENESCPSADGSARGRSSSTR
ncbi:MAG TPA: hypothetical protein VJV74_07220 [Terriglobia bacterium]|nr:hypothetical protein [Terriglobia bacterium]